MSLEYVKGEPEFPGLYEEKLDMSKAEDSSCSVM